MPGHLQLPLRTWARSHLAQGQFFDRDAALKAAVNLRLNLRRPELGSEGLESVFRVVINEYPDRLLQLVHYLVYRDAQCILEDFYSDVESQRLEELEGLLEEGGSVWTVDPGATGLTRRVDATTKGQLAEVLSSSDAASEELREAWSNAYDFNPDPSDAWDHCIKALEALLKPIVVPTNTQATLGHVIGELTSNRAAHQFLLRDNGLTKLTDSYDTLIGCLRLVWGNPDRHQGAHHRTPSISEARGVLATTITVAQWAREGLIK